MPPSCGNFSVSPATAKAKGTKKNSAAPAQRPSEPGPMCAAVASQRTLTTAATLNKTMSRRPNSRRKAGRWFRHSIHAINGAIEYRS